MNFRKNQSFWTSVILHGVVLFGLFLSTIVEAFRPKEKEHVFVMVASPNAPVADAPPPSEPPPTNFDLPDIQELPDIPDPVMPPPPAPAPPRATAPAPTPPKPAAKPKPPRKLVNFDDVRDDLDIREPKPRQQKPRPSIAPPKITSRSLSRLLENSPNPVQAQQMTVAQQTELQRYGARLNGKLNRAWKKPASLVGRRLEVSVVFNVSASGQISNPRLKPSSGNAAFDKSVLVAFRRVLQAGRTPTGRSHTFTMDFRMVE